MNFGTCSIAKSIDITIANEVVIQQTPFDTDLEKYRLVGARIPLLDELTFLFLLFRWFPPYPTD